jgi:hypothetical protein
VTSLIVISLLQFGQISTVGTTEHAGLVLMTFPFARRNVGASEKAHPGVGACQSEKQESEIGRVAMQQRLYPEHCAPIIRKSRGKMSMIRTVAMESCSRSDPAWLSVMCDAGSRTARWADCLKRISKAVVVARGTTYVAASR